MKFFKILFLSLLIAASGFFSYKYFTRPSALALKDCPGCNVVVILVDTLRADHLQPYGYKRETTPFLNSLLEKSALFEKAYSASSWTAPATASVFTSLQTSQHRVISGFLATKRMIKDGVPIKMNAIPKEFETMGEMMAKAGYQTLGVADNLNIGKEMGFDRGFSQFKKFGEKGAKQLNKVASEFIENVEGKGPYFAYLHYMDPHAPYLEVRPWFDRCLEKTDGSEKERAICAYDSEIRDMDSKIRQIFEKYDWLHNSVVFFLADHGEELWDHGDRGHGKTLYTELIHVPFAMYHPKWKGKRIPNNVHTMDLLPTLAALMGKDMNPIWAGQNLLPYLEDGFQYQDRLIFSERLRTPFGKIKWWKRSLVDNDRHYILTEEPEKENVEELFDLKSDYYEQKNLVKEKQTDLDAIRGKFSKIPSPDAAQSENPDSVTIEMDEDLVKQLKTLGYID